ncbi:hypothetical protein TeGR_g1300 [Tetraparma gracilis]|uniref:Uncharacterized protein n=1 Tax=Tetraparma gracilis TaxID=2962635 RepID=A0ABQ6NCB0_9STRA|nr:hypothetical protein TeGR_g1300 [Tetraparma gracilis]
MNSSTVFLCCMLICTLLQSALAGEAALRGDNRILKKHKEQHKDKDKIKGKGGKGGKSGKGGSGMSSMASAETQTSGGMGKTMAEGRTPKISSGMSKTMAKNKTPVPEPPAKCSEMKDQGMCEQDSNADNHCKWDEADNECYKGCPSDGRALEDSMRSLEDEDKCPCPNYVYDSGDGECKTTSCQLPLFLAMFC